MDTAWIAAADADGPRTDDVAGQWGLTTKLPFPFELFVGTSKSIQKETQKIYRKNATVNFQALGVLFNKAGDNSNNVPGFFLLDSHARCASFEQFELLMFQ